MGLANVVNVEMTKPPPDTVSIGSTYKIEGTATLGGEVGPPPWVYARVRKKDWYKPEIVESTDYLRGFPMPIGGSFSMEWTPEKEGIYEVTLVATPAPLALPVIGVPPITGESTTVSVTAESGALVKELKIVSYELVQGGQ